MYNTCDTYVYSWYGGWENTVMEVSIYLLPGKQALFELPYIITGGEWTLSNDDKVTISWKSLAVGKMDLVKNGDGHMSGEWGSQYGGLNGEWVKKESDDFDYIMVTYVLYPIYTVHIMLLEISINFD